MKNVHIGSIIRAKLEESSLSIAEFAERINRTRPTVYDKKKKKSIDTDLLIKISEVLEYNFLQEVYHNLSLTVRHPFEISGAKVSKNSEFTIRNS